MTDSNGSKTFEEPMLLVSNVRSLKEEKGQRQPLREAKNTANRPLVENTMSDSELGQESNLAEERNKTKTKNVPIKLGTKKYRCPFCSQIGKSPSDLKHHILTHTGEQPFSCDVCGKMFNLKTNLTRHNMIHTGEKPYTCNECGKSFNQKSYLTGHVMIHTGEKPFSCNFCDYSSIHKSDVKKHGMIHTGEKPFSCDFCDYACIQKGHLKNHMKNVHGKHM